MANQELGKKKACPGEYHVMYLFGRTCKNGFGSKPLQSLRLRVPSAFKTTCNWRFESSRVAVLCVEHKHWGPLMFFFPWFVAFEWSLYKSLGLRRKLTICLHRHHTHGSSFTHVQEHAKTIMSGC